MPIELLRQDIQRSGLSVTAYARLVMIRDPRTVFRWLGGDNPIPAAVLEYLQDPKRRAKEPKCTCSPLQNTPCRRHKPFG